MLMDDSMPPPPVSFVKNPGEDDFVLPPLPPPPSENDLAPLNSHSSSSSKTESPPPLPSVISPTYKTSVKYNVWMPSEGSKNTNGAETEIATKCLNTTSSGFRSVARPVSKKSEKGPATSTVTTTYGIQTQGLPLSSENVRVTPENKLPQGAVYETQTLEGNVLHTDTYFPAPGEETVMERTKKTTIIKAEHHHGMGPTDDQGIPVALRSTVDDPKQWYKNMFKQIHKFDIEDGENESHRAPSDDIQEDRCVVSQTPTYRPKKLGRITDYSPSEPYVVENKPMKSRADYSIWRGKALQDKNFNIVSNPKKSNSVTDTINEGRIPSASTSFKPTRVQLDKKPQVKVGEEPVHGTEYHEKDYTMADYVVTEPKHVVQINPAKLKETKPQGKKQRVKAKFDFVPQTAKQLSLKKDQVVIVTKEINKDWYEGETTDGKHAGMFPVAYVEAIGLFEHKQMKKGLAKAKFDFSSTNPKQLAFKKGDSIELLEKMDKNWYKGSVGQRNGILPSNYVEIVREPEGKTKPAASHQNPTISSKTADKAPNFNQYFHIASTSSSSSNSEPDDKQKMSKATFLANAVVNREVHLSKPQVKRGEFDIPELDDAAMGITRETKPDHNSEDSLDTNNSTISSDLAHSIQISNPVNSKSIDVTKGFEDDDFSVDREKHVSVYNYAPQNEDELELIQGDVVQVVEKCDDGWYVGTCERTGAFGTFPGNYVVLAD